MIYGIGTDIVRIDRLAQLWGRHGQKGAQRLLGVAELADFALARDKGRFLAKRFAAKEAFAKALGTGIRPPATFSAIEIAHDALGKPFFAFHGPLAEKISEESLTAHLSISDEEDYAMAYVILETR